ncbi:MAG: peptide chain release factor N(5)-glutamine methyltransferase [Halanaerobiaceae bacterium]
MNIKEILTSTVEYFKKHNIAEPRLDAEVLLAHVLKKDRIQLYVNFDLPLQNEEIDKYRNLVRKRASRIPVAYLIGEKEFMSMNLYIERGVLIPRPETEQLVEKVIEYCKENMIEEPNIVDVGSGSGAISVSLAHYIPGSRILAVDISDKAVEITSKNIEKYELGDRVSVIKGDLLSPLLKIDKKNVDIVISNPPYINSEDMKTLPMEVQKEPELALSGGKDGLEFYRKIIKQAPDVLKKSGLLALEIGYNQGDTVRELLIDGWDNIEVAKDYSGHERIVLASVL